MAQQQQPASVRDRRADVESLAARLFCQAVSQLQGKTVESLARESFASAREFYRIADESGRVERPGPINP